MDQAMHEATKPLLKYDKRSGGSHGLALVDDVPGVPALKRGMWLEPWADFHVFHGSAHGFSYCVLGALTRPTDF